VQGVKQKSLFLNGIGWEIEANVILKFVFFDEGSPAFQRQAGLKRCSAEWKAEGDDLSGLLYSIHEQLLERHLL